MDSSLISFLAGLACMILLSSIIFYLDHKKRGASPFSFIQRRIFNIFYNIDENDKEKLKEQAKKLGINIRDYENQMRILNQKPDYVSILARRTGAIIIIVASIVVLLIAYLVNYWIFPIGLLGIFVGLVLFLFPELKVKEECRKKRKSIEDDLIYFSDLLITALRTKMPVWDAILKTAENYPCVLSDEVVRINAEVMINNKSWNDELDVLADKYKIQPLSEFISNIITSAETGSDIVKVLHSTSDYLKTYKLNMVQEAVKKFNTNMLWPLIGFKLLPIMLLIMIPILTDVSNMMNL